MVRQVDEQLLQIGRVEEGDLVVIIAGSPPGIPGSTNALRIHRMGDAINEVAPAYRAAVRTDHCLSPISSSRRATPSRRETLMVFAVGLPPRDVDEIERPAAELADVRRSCW